VRKNKQPKTGRHGAPRRGGKLDLKDLACFLAVCDAGSFHGAASALRVVQSNVSTRIARMESLLAAPLFVRRRRQACSSAKATPAGRKLVAPARRAVAAFERFERVMRVVRR
jgi:DNA-binding transcriptional LysR family regulator